MNYTDSNAYATNTATGHRLHQDTGPAGTVMSAKDINQIIWSLMRLIEGAGVAAANFNADDPNTYNRVLLAVQALAGGGSSLTQGTFTPALRFGGASSGLAYASRTGFFTRQGKLCHFWGFVQLSAKGSSTGNASVSLGTLNAALGNFACQASVDQMAGLPGHVSGMVIGSSNVVDVRVFDPTVGSEATVATHANFTNSTHLYISGSYLEP